MSRLEYASQLWSPYLLKHVYLIEKVQRAFTKHISGMCFLSYSKRLEVLKLYSLQRRRERYGIIYVWKTIEGLVPNLSDPITCSFSDRRGRACVVCHSGAGQLSTYLPYPTLQFSRGVGKREKANGLCNPLMILFRWIFSWLLNLLILFASIAVCGNAFQ